MVFLPYAFRVQVESLRRSLISSEAEPELALGAICVFSFNFRHRVHVRQQRMMNE